MSDVIEIPCYSLSPRCLTLYTSLEGIHITDKQHSSYKNLEDNTNQFNELSAHSVKRLRKAISYMLYVSKNKSIRGNQIISKSQEYTTEYEKADKHQKPVNHKLSIITLTLPAKQQHSEEQIKSDCLNQFLTELRTKFKIKDFIWKAEKQENNNIHFHILINQYIHYDKIRKVWNRIVNKLGYVDAYAERQRNYFANGFKISDNPRDKRPEKVQKAAYIIGTSEKWLNPNSTDIHALYKVKNASAYLTKYLAKGVTKTERTFKIKSIQNEIKRTLEEITSLTEKIYLVFEETPEKQRIQKEISKLEIHLSDYSNSLSELLKSGVSGRIWGQSQSLSKLKNFVNVESWKNIPDIGAVAEAAEFKFTNKVGSRTFQSYIIDINKFPNLDFLLQNHLFSS